MDKINDKDYIPLTPFKGWVIENFPFIEADFDAITNYELICLVVKYLNEVISNQNQVEELGSELVQGYNDLVDYINNYFDNLDVQDEIDEKLDKMAQDGTLTGLIKEYIDPIQEEFENQVNLTLSEQNANIQTIENKVNAVTNGSPLPAESIDDMTDTTRIYVLISTGKWYYYDGDSWEIGGDYQSPISNYDTTLTVNNGVADSKSIGDRINQTYSKKNLLNKNNVTNNKVYNNDGTLSDNTAFIIYNDIIPIKSGDTIFMSVADSGHYIGKKISYIIKVDAYGEFIERITATNVIHYTFNENCFIKICTNKETYDYEDFILYLNHPEYKNITNSNYLNKNNEELQLIKKSLNNELEIINYFDKDNAILNNNLNSTGDLSYTNNGYAISNFIPVKNGDVLRFYNFNATTYNATQVAKYDENGHFTARSSVTGNTFTANFNGYVLFNITKPTSTNDLDNLDITINKEITQHYPFGYILKDKEMFKNVKITKIDNNNFTINFDKFNVTLFKTVDTSTNANNWNLKNIKKGNNVIVPEGTDFIGPVRINDNTDFIGGIHGDETTNHIYIIANGTKFKDNEIENITNISTDYLTILLNSNVYDQVAGDVAFERNVFINIYENKIHISNSYTAKKNLTLKTACTGGLIACRNDIITSIMMNNSYFDTAPTTSPNNHSKQNTYGIINTSLGSVEITNIKGHDNPNYIGYLVTYSNESPIRNKIYFNPYFQGSYNILIDNVIDGEFEYTFN